MAFENNDHTNNSEFFLLKLIHGNYGLFKTFWLFSFIPVLILNQFGNIISKRGTDDLLNFFIFFSFAYSILTSISIWNAANKYTGKKIWIFLSKFSVITNILIISFSSIIFLGYDSFNSHDIVSKEIKEQTHQNTSSQNIEVTSEQKNTNQQTNTFDETLKAAEEGDLTAQALLAIMYYDGSEIPKNYAEAFRWAQNPAKHGNIAAQYLIGSMYYYGLGVEKNYFFALNWLENPATKGLHSAELLVGSIYYNGLGVSKDSYKAFNFLINSAEKGNNLAQSLVGIMYMSGDGVLKDFIQAYKWFNICASQTMPQAGEWRDELAKEMTIEQIAEGQRLSNEWKPREWTPREW